MPPSEPMQPQPNSPLPAPASLYPAPEQPVLKHRSKAEIFILIVGIGFTSLIVILVILRLFVFGYYQAIGNSMAPTIPQHRIFFTARHYTSPQRGDIVVYKPPIPNAPGTFIHRIVALPGERITIRGGKVTVYNSSTPQGLNPDQSYESADTDTLGDIDTTVPTGDVYVMGDNRGPKGSYDSREFGPVPISNIVGKVIHVL